MLTTAIDRLTEKAVHISEVRRGRWAGAMCAECNDNLIARKGDQRRHHFAHATDKECLGESNLHRYAKQLIAKEKKLKLPFVWPKNKDPKNRNPRIQHFASARTEAPKDKFWIDCLLETDDGKELAIEIKVTTPISPQKKAMFREKELGAVEIDISHLSHRNIEPSIKQIRREVLFTPKNMEWIYNQPYDQKFQDIYAKHGIDLRKESS